MTDNRRASLQRETAETYVSVDLTIDGSGTSSIQTGIPFFDHMLALLSRHSLFNLQIDVRGDLEVDFHRQDGPDERTNAVFFCGRLSKRFIGKDGSIRGAVEKDHLQNTSDNDLEIKQTVVDEQ